MEKWTIEDEPKWDIVRSDDLPADTGDKFSNYLCQRLTRQAWDDAIERWGLCVDDVSCFKTCRNKHRRSKRATAFAHSHTQAEVPAGKHKTLLRGTREVEYTAGVFVKVRGLLITWKYCWCECRVSLSDPQTLTVWQPGYLRYPAWTERYKYRWEGRERIYYSGDAEYLDNGKVRELWRQVLTVE